MIIYNRKTKTIIKEQEYKENLIEFLYNTILGRILLKTIIARPWFSKLRAKYQKSKKSKKDIKPFIKQYNIDMNLYKENYECFNDFFIRKRDIRNNSEKNDLVAIADSKLLVYKIDKNLRLNIKNSNYTLDELVKEKINLSDYTYALVFRLSISDYHRYQFLDDGKYIKKYKIKGLLHTVRPISSQYKVFAKNQREVSIFQTKHLGEIIQIEVGALLVGCIQNHDKKEFKKLEEKGYFEYGGSTIILLLKDNIVIDDDILKYSKKHIETKVTIGEKIGGIVIASS